MSVHTGTRIPRQDLILHLDMNNTVKSWKGPPTVNYIYQNGYTKSGAVSYVEEKDLPKLKSLRRLVPEIKEPVVVLSDIDWQDIYKVGGISLAPGEIIHFSVYVYTPSVKSFFNINGDFGSELGSNVPLGGTSTAPPNQWFYYSRSKTNTTASTITVGNLRLEPGYPPLWENGDIVAYACNPQVEIGPAATPFSPSATRGASNALRNISKENIGVTASSLTYNNDGNFSFNGTSDYLLLDSYIELSRYAATVSCWAYIEDFNTGKNNPGRTLLRFTGNNYQRLIAFYDGGIGIETNTNSDPADVSGNTTYDYALDSVTSGQWFHFTIVFKNTVAYYYGNGVLKGSVGLTNDLRFDRIGDGTGFPVSYPGFMKGQISDFMVYNRSLSSTEIQDMFENTRNKYGI
jgi:hypothetical protein